jgi:hypothetical protein
MDSTESEEPNNSSIVVGVFVAAEMFLLSRSLAMIGEFLTNCCRSNDGGIHIWTQILEGEIYGVHC